MGQRITYFKSNSGKGLKETIFDNYPSFRQWYLETDHSSVEEFHEPFGNENLKNYLKQNTAFKLNFDNLEKNLIDELTAEFIGSYCDLTDRDNHLFRLFGPAMNKWRYAESSEMVLATKDEDLIRLCNYIIKGRSLKDNTDFDSYTNDYKIGFLAFTEYMLLKEKIETYFGNIDTIKKKSNPGSSGLEFVSQAIDEIADSKNELITGIE